MQLYTSYFLKPNGIHRQTAMDDFKKTFALQLLKYCYYSFFVCFLEKAKGKAREEKVKIQHFNDKWH